MAERQVDDLHAEARAVGDHVFDRLDDVARLAAALSVEHLEADQPHLGRDALKLAVRQGAAAADQAGDVRAVAVVVERRRRIAAAREVVEAGDASGEIGARRDAGVDDRDADARGSVGRVDAGRARQPERLAQSRDRRRRPTPPAPPASLCPERVRAAPLANTSASSETASTPGWFASSATSPL